MLLSNCGATLAPSDMLPRSALGDLNRREKGRSSPALAITRTSPPLGEISAGADENSPSGHLDYTESEGFGELWDDRCAPTAAVPPAHWRPAGCAVCAWPACCATATTTTFSQGGASPRRLALRPQGGLAARRVHCEGAG